MQGEFYRARWPNKNLLLGLCRLGRFGGFVRLGSLLVFPRETFHASRRVDELLFAREERMALRADFYPHQRRFISRARLERAAAGAMDGNFVIIGVDSGFHACSLPQAVLHGSHPSGLQPRR